MELNNGQSKVINMVLSYINEYVRENEDDVVFPRVLFDELSTTKDSMCLSTVDDSKAREVIADVTGMFISGVIQLKLTYRIMSSTKGNDDLKYIGVVDYIYRMLLSKSREIEATGMYVEKISQISGAKLEAVYSGGVKDFSGSFEIKYERRNE